MKYSVTTLIKIRDMLVHAENVNPKHIDPNYIEGAIIWKVGRKEIFTEEHWDLVDQLWAYCIRGMNELANTGIFQSYFPDQPLVLRFESLPNQGVEVTVGTNVVQITRDEFYRSLLSGGRDFLTAMQRLLPLQMDLWNNLLDDISKIEKIVFGHTN